MAQSPREQQRTDERRIPDGGTGKLDRDSRADADTARAPAGGGERSMADLREQLTRERDAAMEELRTLGVSPKTDESAPRAGADGVLDEGDAAQASKRQDVEFMTRERLGARINQLTAALERMSNGTYGRCIECGREIEPARLAAMPETETCLACQERRERTETDRAA